MRSVEVKDALSQGKSDELDGITRWSYQVNMWTNPILILTVWKVLSLAALAPAILVAMLALEEGFAEALQIFVQVVGLVFLIMSGLMLIAYPIVALIYGGKYSVIFEMDNDGIKHIQFKRQFENSQMVSALAVLAGLATGNSQTIGAGILAGSRRSSYTRFKKVKTIRIHSKRQVIYLNENLTHNQIYVTAEQFDKIKAFILTRCPKAQIRGY